MKLQFLGHNAWSVTANGGYRILIDPFLAQNPAASCGPEEVEADLILVSHGHGDHFGDTLQIAKRTGATVAAIAEIAGYVRQHGIQNTLAMNLGGGADFPFGRVQMVPALHSSTLPDGTPGGNSAGFLLTLKEGKTLYFACDTALFGDMTLLRKRGIDFAMLPIGDLFTMGPDDALEAVKLLKPRYAIPCHFSTWPPISQDPEAWKLRVESETDTKVRILTPGEFLETD
ncbi:MAG: metal-dependent hydrolase [Thermoguttaceae bacterium]|nr:metal-dependent hydrolase [Thermoguttaceae bacterium]